MNNIENEKAYLKDVLKKAIQDAGLLRFVYLKKEDAEEMLDILFGEEEEPVCEACQITFTDLEPEGDDHVRQQ